MGQVYGTELTVIILAGGIGSRMNTQSEYVPKALSMIGTRRAIDHLIDKYMRVARSFVIGTYHHADLLEAYVKGRYPGLDITFVREDSLKNNAVSLLYCLDRVDSRYGMLITFCDLLPLSNNFICLDTPPILAVMPYTEGNIGTFRHTISKDGVIVEHMHPVKPSESEFGIAGRFVIHDTPGFKAIAYSNYSSLKDITSDIVIPYASRFSRAYDECLSLYEFGNENDLNKVRDLWSSYVKPQGR